MIREIVKIDDEKCDGCGLCVPACHEGAIKIVNGKARLLSDALCDGLGACLGHCPQGAITIERRQAEAFDESLVEAQEGGQRVTQNGCPASAEASTHGPNHKPNPANPSAGTVPVTLSTSDSTASWSE